MAKTEPTPGEWFVDQDQSDFIVSTDHGQEIARCLSADDFPCLEEGTEEHMDDEARANALLISAAKNLLAAAELLEKAEHNRQFCDECEDEGEPEVCGKCFPAFDDARVMRRNAIAKARGATPQTAE